MRSDPVGSLGVESDHMRSGTRLYGQLPYRARRKWISGRRGSTFSPRSFVDGFSTETDAEGWLDRFLVRGECEPPGGGDLAAGDRQSDAGSGEPREPGTCHPRDGPRDGLSKASYTPASALSSILPISGMSRLAEAPQS